MHNVQKVLHMIGNLLLVVLLLGLVVLPGASFGLINMEDGKVLSSQSVRLNVTLEDVYKEDYVYNKESDSIIKKTNILNLPAPVKEEVIISQTDPAEEIMIYDIIETVETTESEKVVDETAEESQEYIDHF
jgi:hypothetical protein